MKAQLLEYLSRFILPSSKSYLKPSAKTNRSFRLILLSSFFGLCTQCGWADVIEIDLTKTPPPEGVDPQFCWTTDSSYWWNNYGVGISARIINYGGYDYDEFGNLTDIHCYDPAVAALGRVSIENSGGVMFDNSRVKNVTSVTALLGSVCRTYITDPVTGSRNASIKYPDVMVRAVTTNYEQIHFKVPHPNGIPVTITAPEGSYLLGANYYFDNRDADCDAGQIVIIPYFRIETASATDLMTSTPIVTQTGSKVGPDNIQTVSPGDVQVDVPVSGSNLGAISSGTTTVTLQVGSQAPQSQIVSIAQIQSAGIYKVPFKVPFDQTDIGLQTITATVDPGNVLGESNFSNNTQSVQLRVIIPPYKLAAWVNGSRVDDAGGVYDALPSDYSKNVKDEVYSLGGNSQPQTIQLGCVNTFTGELVSGCRFKISQLSLGDNDGNKSNGGHKHDNNRPFVLSNTDDVFPYDLAMHPIDGASGATLTYWPPIVSGDVKVSILGYDSQGNQIQSAPPITFRVKVPNLVALDGDSYTLKCAGNTAISGCEAGGYQHTDFYNVTPAVRELMSKIGSKYDEAFSDDAQLIINDASLAWGGLYDFKNSWSAPHMYHRRGTDVDVNSKSIPDDNRDEFNKIVCHNKAFPKREAVGTINEHYHLYFYAYKPTIVTLCPSEEL
jgi:hypothetical protein